MNSPLCNENFELFNGFACNERSRFNSTFSIDYRLSDKLTIKPRLLIQEYDGQLDVLPQLLVDSIINERLSLIGGGGISSYGPMFYQVLLGARYDNMTLFFAFDTNFKSGWTPGFLEEAIELSLGYSFPFQRKNE